MKNDITTDEWSVLSEFLEYGSCVYYDWEIDGVLDQKCKLLESAKLKVKKISDVIKYGKY